MNELTQSIMILSFIVYLVVVLGACTILYSLCTKSKSKSKSKYFKIWYKQYYKVHWRHTMRQDRTPSFP